MFPHPIDTLTSCVGNGTTYSIGGTVNYANTNFTILAPDGSKTHYSNPFGSGNDRKHYPVIIQGQNGNRLRVTYKNDQSGRVEQVRDTLNRLIRFYYENDSGGNSDKLVAITIPGIGVNEEIQTVRFYYETIALMPGGFVSSAEVTSPTTIRVLKYVYMPTTKTGYEYEYHPYYGMIKKITRRAGMSASTTATNITGTLTGGTFAASTEYDYPNIDGQSPQADVPKYTKRIDDWQGRTSLDPQETYYDAPEPSAGDDRISTITTVDNGFFIENETRSYYTADWMNGLVRETAVYKSTGPITQRLRNPALSRTRYFWTQGPFQAGRREPRLIKIEATNEAGLTKATEFEYDQYNNQTKVKEYDYAAPDTLGTLLRTTEIEYESGTGWINANLLSLVKSVKRIVAGATASKTVYEYDHGGNDSTTVRRDDIDTATHDTFYNPAHPAWDEEVCPNGSSFSGNCTIIHHPGYTAASAFRGNVTKITSFSDATLTTDPNAVVNNYEYDIAGNLVSATLSCCDVKTIDYGLTFAETGYAFPVKETLGTSPTQLYTEATYNFNTGLVVVTKDENAQPTHYEYETDTLRPKKTIYPNGGYVLQEYSDVLAPGTLPGFVRTKTTLDSTHIAQSYNYFDGRGLGLSPNFSRSMEMDVF